MNLPAYKEPEFVTDLTEISMTVLMESLEISEAEARKVARRIVLEFCDANGGMQVYFPVGMRLQLTSRDRRIFEEYMDGATTTQLAKKYRLSERYIYFLLRRVDASEKQRRTEERSGQSRLLP